MNKEYDSKITMMTVPGGGEERAMGDFCYMDTI